MDKFEWFREAKFGLMIHWGLYCLPAGEWKGERMAYIGEWIQSRFRIPNAEYHALARAFNPMLFNAEEWVSLAQDAGMRYIVFTAKHHEGFAMVRSRASRFNIVDATPFGRDVVEELANACARRGMKLGLYYSQDLDWSEPNGGGYTRGHTNHGPHDDECMAWTNDWDFPENDKKDYSQCFESKIVPQVKEPVSFAQALEYAGEMDLKLIPYELAGGMDKTRALFAGLQPGQSAAVFIGPEGGFEEAEVLQAEQAGFARVTLGKRILRTETAGLAALAMLGSVLER